MTRNNSSENMALVKACGGVTATNVQQHPS